MFKANRGKYIRFIGANYEWDDDGEKIWQALNTVYINPGCVAGFYDHTILTANNKIHVLETLDEIKAKLEGKV